MAKTTKKSTKTTKKAAPSAEEKQVKAQKSANPAVPYIIGFFSLFIILTFFVSETGFLGKTISATLLGLFGAGYYYFPFLLLLLAFYWRRDSEKGAIRSKVVLASSNFIFLLVILNTLTAPDVRAYGTGLYELGQSLSGAGFIGGHIGAFFVNMLGRVAAIILSFLSVLITAVFLFGSTPKATVLAIIKFFKELDFGPESDDNEENIPAPVIPETDVKKIKKTSSVVPDEKNAAQLRFELPDEEDPQPAPIEKDLVGVREINREMPWEEPVSDRKSTRLNSSHV